MLTIAVFLVAVNLQQALGHGVMYWPPPWHSDTVRDPHFGLLDYLSVVDLPVPEEHCTEPDHCRGINLDPDTNMKLWFTNYTKIPGEPTISNDMLLGGGDKNGRRGNPWYAPGTAPLYGEGCGAAGGNPDGCGIEGALYGTCCGLGNVGCGGFTGGRSALEYHAEGVFDGAQETVWHAGDVVEIFWSSKAHHAGGYAYRLCKMPAEGVLGITEECFQNGHLDFAGDVNWIAFGPRFTADELEWHERPAVRTREGTTPPGSQWGRTLTEPQPAGSPKASDYAFKDLVQVPEDLEPGLYILSYRWDCERTPQIWSSCANIIIE